MRNVYIVNKSYHDYKEAANYGNLIFLSEGKMSRYELNNMLRCFENELQTSSSEDYIVLCGLSVMNVAACVLFAIRHLKLNLLLFKNGRYVEQNVVFGQNISKGE